MKKKTLIILCAVLALVLVLAVCGLPLLSHIVYGRSQSATLFAWQLKKETYTTEADFVAHINGKYQENSQPYVLPSEVDFTVSVEEREFDGMQYYILNGSDEPETLIFYFPGGSFTDQPRAVHWQFLNALCADTGAMAVAPIYPKLPAADAQAAYTALTDFYTDFMAGQERGRLLFMGDSAGGGMALSFAMLLRDMGLPGPEQLILICPWVDVSMENPDIPAYEKKDPALDSAMLSHLGALWAGELPEDNPLISPLYGSFSDMGRITLITGTGELLYPDIMLLDEKLTQAGIEHDTIVGQGMFHVWPLYRDYGIPESEETYQDIVRLITGEGTE